MKKVLLILCYFFAQTFVSAQTEIPNASFENWTDEGTYDTPNDWTSLNVLAALGAPAVASKSTDAQLGTYALKLETVSFFGNKIPGLCYLGEYEINLLDPASGTLFGKPFTGRPTRFKGAYKYTPVGADVGGISLQLWRTNPATGKR
ncbi:MAG: PCMD domain-containing protein, partial [Chitinophagales bacterium]|nr:PCMD domain-containing protein [Chitinophagales bacterium]MBP7535304.1 PCMD domain-containing protein [Chitinophagales bacterium]